MYNEFEGIALTMATSIHMNSIMAAHNGENGMHLAVMNVICITNITASHNDGDGMFMNNTHNNYFN